jgi:hypothetical protein
MGEILLFREQRLARGTPIVSGDDARIFYRAVRRDNFSFDLGCLATFFVRLFARSLVTTSAVTPPVEVTPATI